MEIRVLEETVATVSKTTVGTINVPANENWNVVELWGGHGQGGKFGMDIENQPGRLVEMIQNSTTVTNKGSTLQDPVDINIVGPATITCWVVNDVATTGTAKIQVKAVVTQKGQT